MEKLKIASFFAGVGGIDLAFEQTKAFEVVYANEMDSYAVNTYENNFKLKVDCRKIEDVKLNEIPKFDVMIGGFPCTSFSLAGYRKGFEDERTGHLYFELERIFKKRKPKIIFLENVKSLVGHDDGKTFSIILDSLKQEGYYVSPMVMNASEYGNIPQNRERIYIVCFRDKKYYEKFKFPLPIPLTKTIHDIIDFNNKVNDKYYYTKDKYKGDIYEKLVEAMDDEDSVYQWRRQYVRKNMSGVVPTLTANQGEGGHNVCLIKTKYGIRKMTPHECFNTQGYPTDYKLPDDLSDAKLYKQAGNSVVVPVINRIAQNIADIL